MDYKEDKMKEKIEEREKKLQQIISTINQYENQTGQLKSEALMIQGALRVLHEINEDSDKKLEVKKETK